MGFGPKLRWRTQELQTPNLKTSMGKLHGTNPSDSCVQISLFDDVVIFRGLAYDNDQTGLEGID